MVNIHQWVNDIRVIQMACVMSLGGQNWPSIVSLDASSCPLPCGTARGSLRWSDFHQWLFDFFSLLFSLLTGNIQHCPLCFLLFNFKPYSLNLLFCFFFHLYKFFSFQFSYSITICHFLLISFLILLISYFVLIYFIEVLFFNLVL
jgi:hypothetical protein